MPRTTELHHEELVHKFCSHCRHKHSTVWNLSCS